MRWLRALDPDEREDVVTVAGVVTFNYSQQTPPEAREDNPPPSRITTNPAGQVDPAKL